MLTSAVTGQSTDLATDPRLSQPITLDAKMVSIDAVFDAIKTVANVPVKTLDYEEKEISVFVHDCPAYKVMNAIAGVTGGTWKYTNGDYTLKTGTLWASADGYFVDENKLLYDDAVKRLHSLAYLTQTRFDPSDHTAGVAVPATGILFPQFPDETPEQWAERHVSDSTWWLIGLAFASGEPLDMGHPHYRAAPSMVYNVRGSLTKVQSQLPYFTPGAVTRSIPPMEALLMYSMLTGEMRVAKPDRPNNPEEFDNGLIRYPRPPKALMDQPLAKALAKWETPLTRELLAKLPRTWNARPTLQRGNFHNDLPALDDHLESFSVASNVDVVSDSYRVPCANTKPVEAGFPADWLVALASSEKCFLHMEDGVLSVRHAGFWRLDHIQPPAAEIEAYEQIAAAGGLGLEQYAKCATDLMELPQREPGPGDWGDNDRETAFFRTKKTCLLRFDPTPLVRDWPALYAISKNQSSNTPVDLLGGARLEFAVPPGAAADVTTKKLLALIYHTADFQPTYDKYGNPSWGIVPSNGVQVIETNDLVEPECWCARFFGPFLGDPIVGLDAPMLESGWSDRWHILWDSERPDRPFWVNTRHFWGGVSVVSSFIANQGQAMGLPSSHGTFAVVVGASPNDGAMFKITIP